MAGFYASAFKYDGVSSDVHGISMCYIDNSNINTQVNETHTIRILNTIRAKENIFLGYEALEPLTFEITVFSESGLTVTQRRLINKWLVGRNGYKKLEIQQDNLATIYYQCIFNEQSTLYVGEICMGLTLRATCDSPYQHMLPVIATKAALAEPDSITIDNTSDIYDYVYPKLTFTTKPDGLQPHVSIINTSDNNREFKITDPSTNNVFTIDNQNKLMVSNNPNFNFNTFNLKWLRLINGVNVLTLSGLSEISITSPVYVRVGA